MGELKALVIVPKANPIPLHELIRMAGAKAKRIEGKRDVFFNILDYFYSPQHHAYVVLYDAHTTCYPRTPCWRKGSEMK